MIFIETPIFTKRAKELLDDDIYVSFQKLLVLNPSAGVLIEGTGGFERSVLQPMGTAEEAEPG